jgi:tetratricopeptide (TPR) repeat protein
MKWLSRPEASDDEILSLLHIALTIQRMLLMNFRTYETLSDIQNAIERCKQAPSKMIADAYLDTGTAAIEASQLDVARNMLNEALKLYTNEGDIKGQADTYRELARICEYAYNFREGIPLLRKSLELARTINNLGSLGWTLLALGCFTDDLNESAIMLSEAIDYFQKTGSKWGHGLALYNRARLYKALGETAKSKADLSSSLKIFEKSGDMEIGEAFAHLELSNYYFRIEDYVLARKHNDISRSHLKNLKMYHLQALSLSLDGLILLKSNNLEQAIRRLIQAIDLVYELIEDCTLVDIIYSCSLLANQKSPSISATLAGASYSICLRTNKFSKPIDAKLLDQSEIMKNYESIRNSYPIDFEHGEKLDYKQALDFCAGWLADAS